MRSTPLSMYYGAKPIIHERAKELRKKLTPAEKLLWEKLKNFRGTSFHFRCQHPMLRFIADFYCHKAGLVVEIDGEIHSDPNRAEYDVGRTAEMEMRDVRVLRFTNEEIFQDVESVVEKIKQQLQL